MTNLTGKTAFVTGASRGIGADAAAKVVAEIKAAGGCPLAVQADATDAKAVASAIAQTMVAFVAGPEAGYITGASLTVDGGTNA